MQTASSVTESVWSEFSAPLRRFILHHVRDEAAADDILQEAFIKIHLNLGALHDETRLQSWLFQIARNAIADHFRRNRPTELIPQTLTDWAADHSEDACDAGSCVATVLTMLPESYRIPLELDNQGLPQKQIAEQLGLTHTAVKSRVRRGRASLRQSLMDLCNFEFDRRGGVLNCGV